MQVRSERDKEELSSLDTSVRSTQSIRLGRSKLGKKKSLSTSCGRLTASIGSDMLSSISRKLKPTSIAIYSKGSQTRLEDALEERDMRIAASCMMVQSVQVIPKAKQLEYSDLLRMRRGESGICQNVHGARERRGCLEQNCPVKRKWLRKILFYEREVKNAYLLSRNSLADRQGRQTFFPIGPHHSQAHNPSVGQTQGQRGGQHQVSAEDVRSGRPRAGLRTGDEPDSRCHPTPCQGAHPLLHHLQGGYEVRQAEAAVPGRLRLSERGGAEVYRQRCQPGQLRPLPPHDQQIDASTLIPFYLTLFANIVDIYFMHIVINEYMAHGIAFLHRCMLTLLLRLRSQCGEEDGLRVKLGASYIRGLNIDWREFLECASRVTLL